MGELVYEKYSSGMGGAAISWGETDMVAGRFIGLDVVSAGPRVAKAFRVIKLSTDQGEIVKINESAALRDLCDTLQDNTDPIEYIRITKIGVVSTGKGNPMFDLAVDVVRKR